MLGKMNMSLRLGLFSGAVSLALAACSPAAATPGAFSPTLTLSPALVSTTVATTTGAQDGASEPAPTADAGPTDTPFVISDEFTPSDPAGVNLAAGQPQLVEFFAFW